ncbi:hypothetical protein FNV43_RR19319 [Rhamnella rubrinervis]|uniref:Uncharacterized protein n=1 Tax=Rhamnella rubrinervis TaxID=2594499 RepID=A0A8K0E6U9_9ROSA|nr:hypothetical protein FNV43_RR19319 [Rhamnella rubrinervis]
MAMARLILLFALCVAPAPLVYGQPFHIQGRVYCDTCRFGFETEAITHIEAATVELQCINRTNLQVMYSAKAKTDSKGTYDFVVEKDQQDQMCNCNLVHSPEEECREESPGRNKATALLTADNGVVNKFHKVNSMGFFKKQALPICKTLRAKYFASEE